MTSLRLASAFDRSSFEALLRSRDEPSWLRDQRAAAWAKFEELPMPSQRDEEWMRTDIRLFRLDKFGLPLEPSPQAAVPEGLLTHGVELGGQVTSLDSRPHSSRLHDKLVKAGVIFGSLDQMVVEHSELVRKHLFKAVDPHYDRPHTGSAMRRPSGEARRRRGPRPDRAAARRCSAR